MGIDVAALSLLARSRRMGVSFENSLTLGRQRLYIKPVQMRKAQANLAKLIGPDGWPSVQAALADPDGFFEPLFKAFGATETDSIDYSPYEGASVIQDMNAPIPDSLKERYSLVFDGGFLEHVFDIPTAMGNCLQLVRPGGHFIAMLPVNNFCGHGFYQFSPELLFRTLSPDNGFVVREAFLVESLPERIRYFKVLDPEILKERVNVRNSTPLLFWVAAERVEVKELFTSPPLQSDYAATWSSPEDTHADHVVAEITRTSHGSWRENLFRLLPAGMIYFLRILRDASRDLLTRTPGLEQEDIFKTNQVS